MKSSNNVFKEFRKKRRELTLEQMQMDTLMWAQGFASPGRCLLVRPCQAFQDRTVQPAGLAVPRFWVINSSVASFWEAVSPKWDMPPLQGALCCSRSALLQKRGFIKLGLVAGEKVVLQAWKMRQSFFIDVLKFFASLLLRNCFNLPIGIL